MPEGRILVADDEPNLREALRILFARHNFDVLVAEDGQEAVDLARKEQPDVVILDVMMPRLDGYSACRELRTHFRTRHIPIVMLTAKGTDDDKLTGLEGGANDYVTKPWQSKELVQRVKNHIEWSKNQRAVNPLTGLPGNLSILAERQKRYDAGTPFAQIFLDLDNFKAFNDRYGFPVGDTAIRAVAEALVDVVETQGEAGDFVGHIGGDDFIMLTEPGRAEILAEAVKETIDARVPLLYDHQDRTQGFVRVLNRRHVLEDFPLMSVTMACANCDPSTGMHLAQLDDVLSELKQYGKSQPGSVVVTERRGTGEAGPARAAVPVDEPAPELTNQLATPAKLKKSA